jgi:hypothetical protein
LTLYELHDLRVSFLERFNARQNYWLTVTFAVFGALHLAGPTLDIFSKILLGIFYFSVTFLSWVATERSSRFIAVVTMDILRVSQEEASDLEISRSEIDAGISGGPIGWINRGLMLGSVIAFVIYATMQNGLVNV